MSDQIDYYRARAKEYDEWFLRQGRYNHGPELNQLWFSEVIQVRDALKAFAPHGRVLELACGTGLWTQELARYAQCITAVDASTEVIEINRSRLQSTDVSYVQADILNWHPDNQYDVVFFSFWLSHVPPDCFRNFWAMVRDSLVQGGRVFFIDSLYDPTTTARDQPLEKPGSVTMNRRLNDGREYRIIKVFYQPQKLEERLAELGWQVTASSTPHYFLYGMGGRRQ
ncbi:MAG TPA: class I SAM-dependent methyltransferase [Terriglobia bacterium]|nr:class I SAM-dependent methyltransferase [Terriglobia bacterium]